MCCLQDDVPPFPDEQAFAIIQEQLGRPLEAVFSSISEQPVAAASLGQVGSCDGQYTQPHRCTAAASFMCNE
jgi:predicted unusual protein kinase regulating ubiquinone biosynthesis (AarF/ABC1/UbiB family)